MKHTTLKNFIKESNIEESLIRATIKQIGGFNEFKERAEDITNYGADGGFYGFIYYTDTVKFAKANLEVIMLNLEALANNIGEGNEFDIIAGFNGLDHLSSGYIAKAIYSKSEDTEQVLNTLAWYALEEVARSYVDLCLQ